MKLFFQLFIKIIKTISLMFIIFIGLVVFIIVFVVLGNRELHKYYGYEGKDILIGDSVLSISVRPDTARRSTNDVYFEHKDPYSFSFRVSNDQISSVCLNDVIIKTGNKLFSIEKECNSSINKKEKIYSKLNRKEISIRKFNSVFISISDYFKNEEVEHGEIEISGKVEIYLNNGNVKTFIISEILKPVYKEYKESGLINGIMSV